MDTVLPCNGCTACCRGPFWSLELHGKDDVEKAKNGKYEAFFDGFVWRMKYSERGDCIYLTDGGCSIWEDRPNVCRQYDCRFILTGTYGEAVRAAFPHIHKAAQDLDTRMRGKDNGKAK